MKETIKDSREVALQESGIGIIKGIIGAIPFCGPMLNEALFDIRSRIKQRRLEEFAKLLEQRLQESGSHSIDEETIRSEEFSDFLESVIKRILRVRSEKQMGIFSDILASTLVSKKKSNYDVRELYVSIVASLEENEMLILEHLYRYAEAVERYKAEGKKLEMARIDYSQSQVMGVDCDEFKVCFETLISKGLAFDDSFGRLSTEPRSFIKPTQLAIKLIRFIKDCEHMK